MDSSTVFTNLEGLRQSHLRRLRILEQQAAITGVNTRPEVLTEIEDLRTSIAHIERDLRVAEQEGSSPATPSSNEPTFPPSLTVSPTPLIGRELEVAALTSLLRNPNIRLITLTDPETAVFLESVQDDDNEAFVRHFRN